MRQALKFRFCTSKKILFHARETSRTHSWKARFWQVVGYLITNGLESSTPLLQRPDPTMKISFVTVSSILILSAVVGIASAKEGLSDFHTKPIQARFDENTVVWTTHAQARQMGM